MGRAQRRSTSRGASKSRRTPVRAAAGGRSIPWVPLVIVLGVVGVVALVAFLIIQSNRESASSSEFAEVEADLAEGLPGEHVDLQGIYDGQYGGGEGLNNTASHVREDVDYSEQGFPPAGGPHWNGRCADSPEESPPFCGPAPWGVFRTGWAPETVVHNMEHGGVIVWYNTDDTAIRDQLEEIVLGYLEDDQLLVLHTSDELDDDTIALTSWARRDVFSASEFEEDRVRDFIDTHERRFNPEHF